MGGGTLWVGEGVMWCTAGVRGLEGYSPQTGRKSGCWLGLSVSRCMLSFLAQVPNVPPDAESLTPAANRWGSQGVNCLRRVACAPSECPVVLYKPG